MNPNDAMVTVCFSDANCADFIKPNANWLM